MTLFDNKYRIESPRREGWDYADNGYYFVTICTKDREHFFGEIENGEMILNEYGKNGKNHLRSERNCFVMHLSLCQIIYMELLFWKRMTFYT